MRWRSAFASLLPGAAEHLDLAGVAVDEPLADLDGRRLPRAVGAEEAEALPRADVEVEAIDRDDVAIGLPEGANGECGAVVACGLHGRKAWREGVASRVEC